MPELIVTIIDTHPPVKLYSVDDKEASEFLIEWATQKWGDIFDITPPDDPDVIISHVLNALNAQARRETWAY